MATRYFRELLDGYITVGEYEISNKTYIGGGSPAQGNEMRTYGAPLPKPTEWTRGHYTIDTLGFDDGAYGGNYNTNTQTVSVPRVKRVQFLNLYQTQGMNVSITLIAVDFAKYDAALKAKTAKVYVTDTEFLVDFPSSGLQTPRVPKPFYAVDINLNSSIAGDFLDEAGGTVTNVFIYFQGTASFANKYSVIDQIYLENDKMFDPLGNAQDVMTANGYGSDYGRLLRYYGAPAGSKKTELINIAGAVDRGNEYDVNGNEINLINYTTRDGLVTKTSDAYNLTRKLNK